MQKQLPQPVNSGSKSDIEILLAVFIVLKKFCRAYSLVGGAPLLPNRRWIPLSRKRPAGHSEPLDVPRLSLLLDRLPLSARGRGSPMPRSRKFWLASNFLKQNKHEIVSLSFTKK